MSLSEQHPREQGLKLEWWIDQETGYPLSEQHPREQGLKHRGRTGGGPRRPRLAEQHPREQGLKHK